VRIEHRFAVNVFKSMATNCTRDGFGHYDVILRPDRIIKRLIDANVLPAQADVGRLQLGNLKRMGVGTRLRYLDEYQDVIKNYMEDEMGMSNVDEAYRVLCQGSLLAIFTGLVHAESPVLNNVAQFLAVLPHSMQQQILTNKELSEKVFATAD